MYVFLKSKKLILNYFLLYFIAPQKMSLTRSDFKNLSVVGLIQNIYNYVWYKQETNTWFNFDIINNYIYWKLEWTSYVCYKKNNILFNFDIIDKCIWWNFEWMKLKWPWYFPDNMFVCTKLAQDDFSFRPGAPANEMSYYNRLHYGKKWTQEERVVNFVFE